MTYRKYKLIRALSVTMALLVVLAVSVLFGGFLGNFYLGNITREEAILGMPVQDSSLPSRDTVAKKKVLRLKQFEYYSIQVAAYPQRETALALGNSLAQKGLPPVITGFSPFQVLVGFLNNGEKLLPLAESVLVDGQKAVVIKGEVNAVSFKFEANDSLAAEKIAPFLGRISTCLHKGLLLYTDLSAQEESAQELRPKFAMLARELDELSAEGMNLAAVVAKDSRYSEGLRLLSERSRQWAGSLYQLETNWQDTQLLVSQQRALALVEDYHGFLAATN